MPPSVSVLTPTILGREALLEECRLSVRSQTYRSVEHVVVPDASLDGCAKTMNLAARLAKGEWLLPLADDDLLCPGGIATLMAASEGADVVYSPPLVWGEDATQFCGEPPGIPSCALIRAEAWFAVGGYNNELTCREDRDLWERMVQQSRRFAKADGAPTWVYRLGHGENKSRR